MSEVKQVSAIDLSIANQPSVGKDGVRGQQVGSWVRTNKSWLFERFLLVGVLAVILTFVILAWKAEPNCSKDKTLMQNVGSYAKSIRHARCKGSGGCCLDCPFISSDDPRVVINKTAELLTKAAEELAQESINRDNALNVSFSAIPEKERATLQSTISPYKTTMMRCISNVNTVARIARNLDSKHSGSSTISVELLNARNVANTLQIAVSINLCAFLSASGMAGSVVMQNRIESIPIADRTRIVNYETKLTTSKVYLTQMSNRHQEIMKLVADTPTVATSYQGMITSFDKPTEVSSQIANQNLAAMTAIDKAAKEYFDTLIAAFVSLSEGYSSMMNKMESFSNSMPAGAIGSKDVSDLISEGDYNTALIRTALEPEIVSNHQKFAFERASFDSGGGVPALRDDDNDVVKWVGLFGRPTYRRSDGSSADRSSEPLRSIPSDNPTDLMRVATPRLSIS